jgi:uroporphyrinogen decarboxylase
MDSRDRVLMAINHKESDRIPFDLGGMAQSGIHCIGYARLRDYLGLPAKPVRILNINTQQAKFDGDMQKRLLIDATMVYSNWANVDEACVIDDGEYWAYIDEWGVKRIMPKEDGLYYDVITHPLAVDDVVEKFKSYRWPDPVNPTRFRGLRAETRQARQSGKFVVLMGLCPGIVEMYAWLRGFDRFYIDLASDPYIAEMFLDKMAELKIAYWRRVLSEVGSSIDAVNEADDMAGQTNLLLSPNTYRTIIKPYHIKLFNAIKQSKPDVKIIFHTCGAVRKLIPDFIEAGVDILNPVQVSAAGMDPVELKKEFGNDLSFWGGGVDAQNILTNGSAQEIKDHIVKNIDALAPGGGFIFAPTHIIQPGVPPENIMVMWETLQEYGSKYGHT